MACGGLLFLVFLLMAMFPQVMTPYGQKEMFAPWLGAGEKHWLGTNALGYDIFTELVYGAKETLSIGLAGSILGLVLGAAIGVISTFRGIIGIVFNGLIQIFVLLPRLVTVIVLASFVGSAKSSMIFLIAGFSWGTSARTVRAKVLHLSAQPFIENCIIQGFGRIHIILWHILPNLWDVLLSRFLLGVNSCILMESTLSFLGLGDLYYPTWGTMISFAYRRGAFLRQTYAYLLAPGICIMLLSLSFYFMSLYFEEK